MAMKDLLAHIERRIPPDKPEKKIVHPSKDEIFKLPCYPLRDNILSPNIPEDSKAQFSVMSYNILADCYAYNAGYWYCDSLDTVVRHESLMKELSILGYATVLCFQEVTHKYFSYLLQPALTSLGYEGIYQQKDKRHKSSPKSEDGLAIFYNKHKCTLISTQPIILNQLMIEAWKGVVGNVRMEDSCYRDTVGLLTAFSIDGQVVSIGNVHLHFDWMRPDIQSLQGCMCLGKLVEFANFHDSSGYVYCGDFNSQTFTELYTLLTCGYISADSKQAFLHPSLSVSVKKTEFTKSKPHMIPYFQIFEKCYTIPQTVKSAYLTIQGSEPLYTNYTGDFHGCLDYIFYSEGLIPMSILALPDEKDMRSEVALPNSVMSSDHLSLKAEFNIVTTNKDNKI
ncbi:hypothetical protein LOD99_1290 [Oopsacas minuta]|uniref:Endonuclease/exonuclease/phosphatase domain-containing protein n=1 Tax=Oopsacas minuta TaxID=111878 RepID=A0AAV7K7M4_9METZ|nr:hypothetical protein LOD99_1290 [Oopsacas minuta]